MKLTISPLIFRCFYDFNTHFWLVVEKNPLKNMNVNWDDEIPNSHGKIKFMFQTTNQHLVWGNKTTNEP